MTSSSILGGQRVTRRAAGKDVDALGPSDSSDSGSDVQGESAMATEADGPDEIGALPVRGASDSDAFGTGERGSATGRDTDDNHDIAPDSIVDADSVAVDERLDASEVEALGSDDDDADDDPVDDAVSESDERPRREPRHVVRRALNAL